MDGVQWFQWIEDQLALLENGKYYLVDIDWKASSNQLVIYLDCDAGVTLGECQSISRHLEHAIDAQALLGDEYALDVSSPGLDRPLTTARQFLRNKDRLLKIKLKEGGQVVGKLCEVSDEGIAVLPQVRKGKQKAYSWGQKKNISFEDIDKSFVEVRFK